MKEAMLIQTAPALRDTGSILRRSCSCGGTCASCRTKHDNHHEGAPAAETTNGQNFSRIPSRRGVMVRVGPADDAFEREADRVADAVIGGSIALSRQTGAAGVQRELDDQAEASAAEDAVEAEPLESDDGEIAADAPDAEDAGTDDDPTGQPKRADGAPRMGGRAELPLASGGGASLDHGVRRSMEAGIGHDFSRVRIHTDAAAARSAASIHARAFTLGSDIYFDSGAYETSSRDGLHLLAHELTHVVQQSAGSVSDTAQRQSRRRRRPVPPPSAGPPRRRRSGTGPRRCTVHGRPGIVPCGPPTCDGQCSGPVEPAAHNPCCGNETCPPSSAINSSFFIRHLDVNLTTQRTTAEWGTRARTLSVATFLTSPNAGVTPPGTHHIGEKCGPCHTNGDGHGMAWLAGFDGIRIGFHDSQRVATGVSSAGCVRVPGCGCAREIHDNTWSGITSVCVHSGAHCNRAQPGSGALDSTHSAVCGQLHVATPPRPATPPARPGRRRSRSGGRHASADSASGSPEDTSEQAMAASSEAESEDEAVTA